MQTTHFGKNLIELNSIDSTNNFAKELLSKERPEEGSIISATEQFGGRGQMGNTWKTEPGKNLTISIILYPTFLEAGKQFFLNMAVALAIKDFCEFELKDQVKIKWPNDIYYSNSKLGGVLIENSISGSAISSSVIGVGLNVNQQEFDKSLPNPTSFVRIRSASYDIKSLIFELGAYMEKYYKQLQQLNFSLLERAYTDSLYRYQQSCEFKKEGKVFKGEISGVTKEGKLVINSDGKELRFAFKEVEYVI